VEHPVKINFSITRNHTRTWSTTTQKYHVSSLISFNLVTQSIEKGNWQLNSYVRTHTQNRAGNRKKVKQKNLVDLCRIVERKAESKKVACCWKIISHTYTSRISACLFYDVSHTDLRLLSTSFPLQEGARNHKDLVNEDICTFTTPKKAKAHSLSRRITWFKRIFRNPSHNHTTIIYISIRDGKDKGYLLKINTIVGSLSQYKFIRNVFPLSLIGTFYSISKGSSCRQPTKFQYKSFQYKALLL